MKVTLHGDNLYQLTYLGCVNMFLVREEDGFTLIDTALESCAEPIIQAAQQLGSSIVRIVLTHAHDDHAGGLDKLHELLPEAEFAISARDARFLSGDMSLDADEPKDKLRGGWHIHKTRPSRLLSEGDHIGSLEVITSPGHTPGHASFLDVRDGTLIAGDAFQTLGGVAVSGMLTLFPLPAFSTWHKPTCLESARKLRTLNPTRLAVGHGRVLEQPLAAMDRAIEQAARKLGQQEQSAASLAH
jgi:glyoxylase-like metal-dependent hydrolase (beta-lactamase superfamily II)